jgi:hypothetical protein
MSVEKPTSGLSHIKKLMLLETLRADTTRQPEESDSSPWHEASLNETRQRLKEGREAVFEWAVAKKQLRGRR